MKTFSRTALALAAGFVAFIATPHAQATPELKLTDGTTTATQTAFNCGTGCETLSTAIGSWNINNPTGTYAPGQSPLLDLNSIDHHNASSTASTMTIEWSVDNITTAYPGFQLNIGGTIGAGGTLTAALYGGNSDSLFDLSNQIGSKLTFTAPPTAFSGSSTGYLASLPTTPYSLTEVVTITFGKNAGQASFDYSVDAVPEPAAVVLLGSFLLVSGTVIRRRNRKQQAS
jgi:hypothetical protein